MWCWTACFLYRAYNTLNCSLNGPCWKSACDFRGHDLSPFECNGKHSTCKTTWFVYWQNGSNGQFLSKADAAATATVLKSMDNTLFSLLSFRKLQMDFPIVKLNYNLLELDNGRLMRSPELHRFQNTIFFLIHRFFDDIPCEKKK